MTDYPLQWHLVIVPNINVLDSGHSSMEAHSETLKMVNRV